MRSTRTAQVLLAAGMLLVATSVAFAQTEPPKTDDSGWQGWKLEGYGEAGFRFLPEDPNHKQDAKFEEYRDINQGLYLEDMRVRLYRPDEKYSVELSGKDWGLKTQEFHLLGEQLGVWQAGFDWDQMRHIYSTTARTLETEFGDGTVWKLPASRPTLPFWNNAAAGLGDVGVQWNTAHVFFKSSPTEALDIQADYTRIHKDGERPQGMAFGSPGGIFLQILEPINQTIHDFRLRASWVTEQWQLQLGYTLSLFVEDDPFFRADNPCNPISSVPPPSSLGACPAVGTTAQFGTMSLPPSNQAHTVSLSGGVNLPMHTRLNANVSYSLRLQDDPFLQQTYSNSLSLSTPSVRLPAKSLGGDVQIGLLNLTLTSRPLPAPVTFTTKYRLYSFNDRSRQPSFEGYLLNDQGSVSFPGPGPEPFRSVRESYTKQNGDLDARWKIAAPAALTVGAAWEEWLRSDVREVPKSDEFFAKAALDYSPNDWLLIRATYLPSFRRISRYNTDAQREVENNAPPGEGNGGSTTAPVQSFLLRKYDESDRDRQRADLMVQFTPLEGLTFTPSFSYRWDRYLDPSFTMGNMLGLQNEVTWSAGMDASWTPSKWLSLESGYMYESNFQKMQSRNRYITAPGIGDTPAANWISDMTDTVQTVHLSAKATLIPDKLDLKLSGNYSYALGTVETRNPNLAGANNISPAVNGNTLAQRFPAYTDSLLRLEAALVYKLTKNLTAKLYYIYETYNQRDWQTDTLNPFLPGVASIYLGSNPSNYSAQIVGATLRYKFE